MQEDRFRIAQMYILYITCTLFILIGIVYNFPILRSIPISATLEPEDKIELLEKELYKKNSKILLLEEKLLSRERSQQDIVIDSLNEVIDSLDYDLDIKEETVSECSQKAVNLTKDVDNYRVLVDKLSDEINNLERKILLDSLNTNLKISRINQGMSTRYYYDKFGRYRCYININDTSTYNSIGLFSPDLRWLEDSAINIRTSIRNDTSTNSPNLLTPINYNYTELESVEEENKKLKLIIVLMMSVVLFAIILYFFFLLKKDKL